MYNLTYSYFYYLLTYLMYHYKLASCVMTNVLHTFMYYCVTDSISVKIYTRWIKYLNCIKG